MNRPVCPGSTCVTARRRSALGRGGHIWETSDQCYLSSLGVLGFVWSLTQDLVAMGGLTDGAPGLIGTCDPHHHDKGAAQEGQFVIWSDLRLKGAETDDRLAFSSSSCLFMTLL